MSRELAKIIPKIKPYLEEIRGLGRSNDGVEYFLGKLIGIIQDFLEEKYKKKYSLLREVEVKAYPTCSEKGIDGANVQVVFTFVKKEDPYFRVNVLLYSSYWSLNIINDNLERLIVSLLDEVENSLIALPILFLL